MSGSLDELGGGRGRSWGRGGMWSGQGQVVIALRLSYSSTIICPFFSLLLHPLSVHLHKFHLRRIKLKLRKNTSLHIFEAHLIFLSIYPSIPEGLAPMKLGKQKNVNLII